MNPKLLCGIGCVVAIASVLTYAHFKPKPAQPIVREVEVIKVYQPIQKIETVFVEEHVRVPVQTPIETPRCEYQKSFSEEQWRVIESSFVYGYMDDLQYSLAAIAIVESSAGLMLENYRTMDFGVHQINIKTARTRLKAWEKAGRDFGRYNLDDDDDLIELLITRHDINAALAIEELQFWLKSRDTWFSAWASYNGGYYHNTTREERAVRYAAKVHHTINKLRTCEDVLMRYFK